MASYDDAALIQGFTLHQELLGKPAYDPRGILTRRLLTLAIVAAQLACSVPHSDAQPSISEYLEVRRELVSAGLQPVQEALGQVLDSEDASLSQDREPILMSILASCLQGPLLRALLPAILGEDDLLNELSSRLLSMLAASPDARKALVDDLVPHLVPSLVTPVLEASVAQLRLPSAPQSSSSTAPGPGTRPSGPSQRRSAETLRYWPCQDDVAHSAPQVRSRSTTLSGSSATNLEGEDTVRAADTTEARLVPAKRARLEEDTLTG